MDINTLNSFTSNTVDEHGDSNSILSLLNFCLHRDVKLCQAFSNENASVSQENLQSSLGAFIANWCEIISFLLRLNEENLDFPFSPHILNGTTLLMSFTSILIEHSDVLSIASFDNFAPLEKTWSKLVIKIKDREYTDFSFNRDQVAALKENLHDLVKSCPGHITHHASFTRVQRFLIHTPGIKTTHQSPSLPLPNFVNTLSLLNALVMDAPDLASHLRSIIVSATSASQIIEIDNHLHNNLFELIREQGIEENINPYLHEFVIHTYIAQLAALRDDTNRTKILRSLIESLRLFEASDVHAYYDIAIVCYSSSLLQESNSALYFFMILLLVINKGLAQCRKELANDLNNHSELFNDLCDYTLSHDRICDPYDVRLRTFPEAADSFGEPPFIYPRTGNDAMAPYRGVESYYPPVARGEADSIEFLVTSPEQVKSAPFEPEPEYVVPYAPLSTVRIELHRLFFRTLLLFSNSLDTVKKDLNASHENNPQFFKNSYRVDVFSQEEIFIVIPPFETPPRLAHFINRFLFGNEALENIENKLPKNYYQIPLLVTLIDGMISLRLKDLMRDWLNDMMNPLTFHNLPAHLCYRSKYLITQFYLTAKNNDYDSIELSNNVRSMLFVDRPLNLAVNANVPSSDFKDYSDLEEPVPNSDGSPLQQHLKHPHRSLLHASMSFAVKNGSIVALLNSEAMIHLLTVVISFYKVYSPQSLVSEASSITSIILSHYSLEDGKTLNTRTGDHLGSMILICLEALRGPFTFPLIPVPIQDMTNWLQEFEGAITTPNHVTLLETLSSNLWLLRKDIVALRWIRVTHGHRFPSFINFSLIAKSPLYGNLRSLLLLLEGGQYDLAMKRYREILNSSRMTGNDTPVFNTDHLNYLVNFAVSFDTSCPELVMTSVAHILREQLKNTSSEFVFTVLLQLVPAWKGLFLMGAFINNFSESAAIAKEKEQIDAEAKPEIMDNLAKSYFTNQQGGIMKVLNTIFVSSMIDIYVDIYKERNSPFKQSHLNIVYMKQFVNIFKSLVRTCLGQVTKTFPICFETSRSFENHIETLCSQFSQLPIAYALRQVYPDTFDSESSDIEVIGKILETEDNPEWQSFLNETLGVVQSQGYFFE